MDLHVSLGKLGKLLSFQPLSLSFFLKVDIEKEAAKFREKIKKLEWEITNAVSTEDEIDTKIIQISDLKKEIGKLEAKLTELKITKLKRTQYN